MCVSWSTDEEGGRWVPSGCEIIEVSETHTVCRCKRMANLAIIMASGELTVSTGALCSVSRNPMGETLTTHLSCASHGIECLGRESRKTEGVCARPLPLESSWSSWEAMTLMYQVGNDPKQVQLNNYHRLYSLSTDLVPDPLFEVFLDPLPRIGC